MSKILLIYLNIPTFTSILVHLTEYLYELYRLTSTTPPILTIQFSLLRNL